MSGDDQGWAKGALPYENRPESRGSNPTAAFIDFHG